MSTPPLPAATATHATDALSGDVVGLGVFLLIGLFGGAHCLGMCGPLVTTYTERMGASTEAGEEGPGGHPSRGPGGHPSRGPGGHPSRGPGDHPSGGPGGARGPGSRADRLSLGMVRQHALFNVGRAVSYALIGGLFGLAGSLVGLSVREVSTFYRELNIVVGGTVGLLIIGAGLTYLFRGHVPSLPGAAVFGRLTRVVQQRLTTRIDSYVGGPGIVTLGALHGLLPCPLLYPAFLYAFAQTDPVGGAAALAVLGAGTIPSLFLYGTLFGSLSARTRQRLHRVLGVAFVFLGYIPLQHALMLLGIHLPHPPIPFYQPL